MPERIYDRRHSLAGPVVLVALGVILLLANFEYLDWLQLGRYFARYWPVLLILVGTIRLLEYYRDRRAGISSRMGVGGALALVLLVIFGLAASAASRFHWQTIRDDIDIDGNFRGWLGNRYSFERTLNQAFPAGASLQVVSDRGGITVRAWDEPQLQLVVHKQVWSQDQARARQVDQITTPVIMSEGQQVTINANTRAGGRDRVTSDLEIVIPRSAAVDLASGHGDIVVSDRDAAVKTSSSHGDVTFRNIRGDVTVDLRHGSLQATQVAGSLAATGHLEQADISDVGGSVRLEGGFFSQVRLARIAGPVSLRSSRTELDLAHLGGELTLASEDLQGRDLTGPLRVVSRSKKIRLEQVSGDVQVKNANGPVELSSLHLGSIQIENSRGEVHLSLPERAGFQLHVVTERGEISTDFSGVQVSSEGPRTLATGSIGGGGPRLEINSRYGDVEIRKAATPATALPALFRAPTAFPAGNR